MTIEFDKIIDIVSVYRPNLPHDAYPMKLIELKYTYIATNDLRFSIYLFKLNI